MDGQTIAAIATAAVSAGIGIIRISGPDAVTIADQIFKKKSGKGKLADQKSHTIHYGHIEENGKVLDEVLVSIMKGPHSYTREDCIEINCHGGIHVMRKVLETVLLNGAVLAEPGEFTKRAFLNGRIDLTQAEAVIDIINAKNDMALQSSVSQLEGVFYKKISNIREQILYQIAFIESALDDPEHISLDGYPQELLKVVTVSAELVEELLKTANTGRVIREGIQTVILGKPNAGKSSLLNSISRKDRAIVTEVEGTTRDILEEFISLDGISLNVIDTAGIRFTEDIVEKIGVEKSRDYAQKADLILYVVDGSKPIDERDYEIIEIIRDKRAIILLNKSDIDMVLTKEIVQEKIDKPVVMISAKYSEGISELEELVKEMFFEGKISFNDQIYITNIRHAELLRKANDSLYRVKDSILNEMPEDFYSIDLMDVYEYLGHIIGESVGEDVVNEIFDKFCTGK